MGVKVQKDGVWYNVQEKAKYSVDGGVTWVSARRLIYFDPITQTWQRGVSDAAPADIVNPTLTITWSTTANEYVANSSWATVSSAGENDFVSLQYAKVTDGVVGTTQTVAYSSLTGTTGATTSFSPGNVTDAGYTQVAYRYRIVDSKGLTGAWSETPTVRVPPRAPTGIITTFNWNGTRYQPSINWTPPAGTVSSYTLTYDSGGGPTTVSGITVRPCALTLSGSNDGGTLYNGTITAVDPAGTAGRSASYSFRTPPDNPTSLALTGMDTSTATASWNPPTNNVATGYRYRWSTDGGASFGSWITVGSATRTATYSLVEVSQLTIEVQTINSTSTLTTSFGATATAQVIPSAPTVSNFTITDNSSVSASWTASNGIVQRYEIHADVNGSGYTYRTAVSGSLTGSFSVEIDPDTLVGVKVIAVHQSGNQAESLPMTKTSPPNMTELIPSFSYGSFRAAWVAVPATSFSVTIRNSSGTIVRSLSVPSSSLAPLYGGGASLWTDSSPSSYAANTNFYATIKPSNDAGTGKSSTSSTVRKLPNPVAIYPQNSATWRDGAIRTNIDTIRQGKEDSTVTASFGAYYYSESFKNTLSTSAIGYTIEVQNGEMYLERRPSFGSTSAISPRIFLHTRTGTTNDPTNTRNSGWATAPVTGTALRLATTNPYFAEYVLPASWVEALIAGTEWFGLGVYINNTADFMALSSHVNGQRGVIPGRVNVYHYN